MHQLQWPTFLQQPVNFLPNSPLLGQVPALDLSRLPQFPQMQGPMPSWNVAAEQTGKGVPGVASNPGTLVSDMSGIEATMGENANALPTADQFAQSLTGLADEQKNRFVLCARRDHSERRVDGTHGKGDDREAYPSHFCPHYPYASWQRDREFHDHADYAYYFNDNLCTVGERRADPHAETSGSAKR